MEISKCSFCLSGVGFEVGNYLKGLLEGEHHVRVVSVQVEKLLHAPKAIVYGVAVNAKPFSGLYGAAAAVKILPQSVEKLCAVALIVDAYHNNHGVAEVHQLALLVKHVAHLIGGVFPHEEDGPLAAHAITDAAGGDRLLIGCGQLMHGVEAVAAAADETVIDEKLLEAGADGGRQQGGACGIYKHGDFTVVNGTLAALEHDFYAAAHELRGKLFSACFFHNEKTAGEGWLNVYRHKLILQTIATQIALENFVNDVFVALLLIIFFGLFAAERRSGNAAEIGEKFRVCGGDGAVLLHKLSKADDGAAVGYLEHEAAIPGKIILENYGACLRVDPAVPRIVSERLKVFHGIIALRMQRMPHGIVTWLRQSCGIEQAAALIGDDKGIFQMAHGGLGNAVQLMTRHELFVHG